MSVSAINDWRRPGCGVECWPRRHDPYAHEQYGRELGRQDALAAQQTHHVAVRTGPLEVDTLTARITVNGHPIHLTATERRCLTALARHVGKIVEYDDLIAATWGGEYLHVKQHARMNALRTTLWRIRQELGDGDLIATIVGLGVRLEALPPVGAQP